MMGRVIKIAYLLSSVVLVACASAPPSPRHTLPGIDEALADAIASDKETAKPTPPPSTISNALLPPIQLNLPQQADIDVEPRFDLKVAHANARDFFMGLVDGTQYNMVVHPEVKGSITLDLKNVSIEEVMQTVRSVYGYDYEHVNNLYRVFPDEIRTRIFKIDYLAVKRDGTSKMRVSSGEVTQTGTQQAGNTTNNNYNNTNSSNNSNIANRDSVAASSIDTVSDSDFWKELRTSLEGIVGKSNGRGVVVSPQSGVIVVRALPSELRAVAQFLNDTQEVMHRQVLLEAKVIEVTLGDGFQAGINWAALGHSGNSQALASQTGGGTIFDTGSSDIAGGTGDLNPGSPTPVTNTLTSAFGGIFSATLKINQSFAAFIELMKTQGNVQILSSPQVSTMNNQKAVIKVGTDQFYVTNVTTNTNYNATTADTQNNVELTPFFSGVALDVIPQISADDQITLHIHPTVVRVTQQDTAISISGTQTLNVPLAVSKVRETDTVIRARDGQVVILGGLMTSDSSDADAAVPFLGDLPLIGNLFKQRKQSSTKTELVILLKPTVIDGPQKWQRGLQRVRDNLQGMMHNNSNRNREVD